MKKIFNLMSFVAIATLFFVGCNKENSINEQDKQDVVLNLDVNVSDDANTKAKYKTGWVEGDKLYLLFANNMFEYEPAKYVEVTYTSTKWKVTHGQEVLNGLKKSGSVDICYCSGTPSTQSDGTIKFPNTAGTFTMVTKMKSYTITNKVIYITTKITLDAIQLNIKNLPASKKAILVNLSKKNNGELKYNNDSNCYGDVSFSKNGIGRGYIENNYPAQATSDPNESAFFFKPWSWQEGYTDTTPRLTLIIPINGKDYTMVKSLTNLDLTINQCYYVKGPSATDEEIKTAAANTDLGNGWYKAQEVTFN